MAEEALEEKEVQEGKIFAVIAYLGILCIVALLLKKDNKFTLFHGKQGLVLFIGELAALLVTLLPILGWIVGTLACLAFGLLSLAGIIQALMGKYWKMPIVGDIAENIKL